MISELIWKERARKIREGIEKKPMPITHRFVMEKFGVSKSTANEILSGLVERGVIRREEVNEGSDKGNYFLIEKDK